MQTDVANVKIKIEDISTSAYNVILTKDISVHVKDKEFSVKETRDYYCIIIPNEKIIITGVEDCVISWDILRIIVKLIDQGKLKL